MSKNASPKTSAKTSPKTSPKTKAPARSSSKSGVRKTGAAAAPAAAAAASTEKTPAQEVALVEQFVNRMSQLQEVFDKYDGLEGQLWNMEYAEEKPRENAFARIYSNLETLLNLKTESNMVTFDHLMLVTQGYPQILNKLLYEKFDNVSKQDRNKMVVTRKVKFFLSICER